MVILKVWAMDRRKAKRLALEREALGSRGWAD